MEIQENKPSDEILYLPRHFADLVLLCSVRCLCEVVIPHDDTKCHGGDISLTWQLRWRGKQEERELGLAQQHIVTRLNIPADELSLVY